MHIASTQEAGGTDVGELRGLGLFGALDDAALAMIARRLTRRSVAADEIIYREGDTSRRMFVVLEGEVLVGKRSRRGNEVTMMLVEPGGCFGEDAVLGLTQRLVTARAAVATRLLEIPASILNELYRGNLKAYALLLMNLARELSRKLQRLEQTLADATTPSDVDR
jgi:CRP-like cAMP-binding protein